ncbi:MAG: CHAP domain-containing protein [Christensenella sp.]|nr:CHAP domain-containing protein [Christensenella sp.]
MNPYNGCRGKETHSGNPNRGCKGRIGFLMVAMLLIAFFTGCTNQTVSALDYTLENELYAGEQGGQTEQPPAESAAGAAEETPPAPTESALVEATPDPANSPGIEPTAAGATPTPDVGETGAGEQTPVATCRYTILVKDESGAALSGARVALYQAGGLLYSEISGNDGSVFWMLPTGQSYYALAELAGYRQIDNGSYAASLNQDKRADIILARSAAEEESGATPTPLPVPGAPEGKVTIAAADVTIQAGDSSFSLKDGVSAKTEFDQTVSVWVVNDGGFLADEAGVYTVVYGALENGMLTTVTRIVTVEGEAEETVGGREAGAPAGSSKERYEILLAYRNGIYAQMSDKIAELTADYQRKIAEATAANTGARILAEVTAENDTDEMPTAARDVQEVAGATVTNWPDILATFLAQNVADEENPLNADMLESISLSRLDSVFWDMNRIEVYRIDGQANVLLTAKTYEDMASDYHLSDRRKSFLYELMQPEFQRTFASLTGNTAFDGSSEIDPEQVLQTLPENVNLGRKQVVEKALSLVGKVKYVWGGKYNCLGWSSAWGGISDEAAERIGSVTSRSTVKGLDCSGFVSWVFINAAGDPAALGGIGNGSNNQWKRTVSVGWDEGRPGDLAFFYVPGERQINHVGIIVSVDSDGSYLVAHCSSRQHGVVVTDGWSTGFRYIRRPAFFQ